MSSTNTEINQVVPKVTLKNEAFHEVTAALLTIVSCSTGRK